MGLRLSPASLALLAAAVAAAALAPTAAAQGGDAVEVDTVPFDAEVDHHTYPVLDQNGTVVGSQPWRVVMDTGNCCEHYLASTAAGRLLDFGGTYLRFSDDAGRTWRQVQLPGGASIPTGEGAVVAGPGGDVLAVGWTPYGGDQLWAHKYEASEDAWYYAPIPAHAPFYDRPWITALQGPFDARPGATPYLTLVSGGFPLDRPFLVSEDGLRYDQATAEGLSAASSGPAAPSLPETLEAQPDRDRDFSQPHPSASVASVGQGLALGQRGGTCGSGVLLTQERRWTCSTLDLGSGWIVMDAAGTLHRVDATEGDGSFEYAVSHDGGDTWTTRPVRLPGNLTMEGYDVKAQATSGTAVVAVHARDPGAETDVDLAYRFRNVGCAPHLAEILQVGRGNANLGGAFGSETARFDFSSLALLPGGRIAMSFADEAHKDGEETSGPGLAVERGSFPAQAPASVPEPGNCPPEAAFSVTPVNPAPGVPAVLDASASADPDGDVVGHEWRFGDGATATGERVTHAFDEPGTYTASLTVTDEQGAQDTRNRTVVVRDPASSSNEPPEARFRLEQVGSRVVVDAANATDPDGRLAAYRWSFGDGATAAGVVAAHTYGDSGRYEVTFTAVDEAGAATSNATTVRVGTIGTPIDPQATDERADTPAPGASLAAVAGALAAALRRRR